MVASQELEVGDVLRRFKTEVSQDEPRRGNNNNRHTRSTSAQCLEIVTVCGIILTCVGVLFFFSSMAHVSVCSLVAVCFFFLAIFCNG